MTTIESFSADGDYRFIEVRPVAGSLGAEILGADLSSVGDDGFDEIYRAFCRISGDRVS